MAIVSSHIELDRAAKIFYYFQDEKDRKKIDKAIKKMEDFKNPTKKDFFHTMNINGVTKYTFKVGKYHIVFVQDMEENILQVNDIIAGIN